MVQTLTRCRECGLPGKLAEDLEWRRGGIVVLRRFKSLRLALIDKLTVCDIHAALVDIVGAGSLLEVEKEATRAVAASLAIGFEGRLSRFGSLKKRILEAMEDYSLLLGMGRIELERFAPGEGGTMLLRRPFDLGITMAAVTGALEEMDQCAYTSAVSSVSEKVFRLTYEVAGHGEADEDRQGSAAAQTHPAADGEDPETCGRCGLPLSIAGLQWDEVYGVIQAGTGGRRVSWLPAYLLAAMDRIEGVSRGREGVVEETVFNSVRKSLENGEDDFYESAAILQRESGAAAVREKIHMRGWGAVVGDKLDGKDWRIEVLNPVSEELIAGWLRALYTVAMGREPLIEVSGDAPLRCFELG